MLGQRVVTAVILLAVLLGALLLTSQPSILLALLVVAASCALWEWLRLTWPVKPSPGPLACASLFALALCALAFLWLDPSAPEWGLRSREIAHRWLLPVVVALWLTGGLGMVARGHTASRDGAALLSVFGVLALAAAWIALAELFLQRGAWFLVSLLALVWVADIFAYFSGKAFGRHKLAPAISPGKTWEGAVGGVVAAAAWVALSTLWPGSFGAALRDRWSWPATLGIAVGLAALSIVGDLFESLLKRRAGVKDSSNLLPGHGGVYDRVDALLPVAPLAFLLAQAGIR
ncbi:MAG: phosphatidate cytidylyltransferase [Candidimonas sp.]|nr:MAG: phosphatidate cytidylyltransferase [Candidimonas sp.]